MKSDKSVYWVYDVVWGKDKKEIIALFFHRTDQLDACLDQGETKAKLAEESFTVGVSIVFNSLQEARANAGKKQPLFHPSLD